MFGDDETGIEVEGSMDDVEQDVLGEDICGCVMSIGDLMLLELVLDIICGGVVILILMTGELDGVGDVCKAEVSSCDLESEWEVFNHDCGSVAEEEGVMV